MHTMPNATSLDFIMQQNGEITFEQNDEDLYVVSQDTSCSIFGEDVFTEDNILQHFIFNNTKTGNDVSSKISPSYTDTIYSKAQ